MTDTILKLAKQAFISERVSRDPNYKESVSTEIIVSQLQGTFEKFAELIIKECLELLYSEPEPSFHLESKIKSYFGVEL